MSQILEYGRVFLLGIQVKIVFRGTGFLKSAVYARIYTRSVWMFLSGEIVNGGWWRDCRSRAVSGAFSGAQINLFFLRPSSPFNSECKGAPTKQCGIQTVWSQDTFNETLFLYGYRIRVLDIYISYIFVLQNDTNIYQLILWKISVWN